MYNITILRDEVAFLREAIAKKYCEATKEDPREFLIKITGSIKYYETIGEMMREDIQDVKKVTDYTSSLTDSAFKINLRKWLQSREDERNRRLGELSLSLSANVLRKLIFYGLQQPEQTFKDAFVLACYIYIGVDRNEWMAQKKPALSDVQAPRNYDTTAGTVPPFRVDQAGRQETVSPYRESIKCTLVAIDDKEQPTEEILQMEFTGKPLVLNRENLGPDNNTITSQVQAMLHYKEGRWELENGSRYKTTYIQVIKPATIQKGDIIVFGNKRFLFLED